MKILDVSKAVVLFAMTSVLLAGCSSPEGSPPAAFEECADESLPTLVVKVRTAKDAYRPGEFARLRVLVQRAAQTDEHGEGPSQEVGPVEGAEVTLGATVKDVTFGAGGTTDENGRARIKMKVKRYVPAGVADIMAAATLELIDLDCAPKETGHVEEHGLFRVIRR